MSAGYPEGFDVVKRRLTENGGDFGDTELSRGVIVMFIDDHDSMQARLNRNNDDYYAEHSVCGTGEGVRRRVKLDKTFWYGHESRTLYQPLDGLARTKFVLKS